MINKGILMSILTFLVGLVYGQEGEILPTDSVEVIKRFDVQLQQSEKRIFGPTLPEKDSTQRSYYYKIDLLPMPTVIVEPNIIPHAFSFPSPFQETPYFIELGMGAPLNLLAKGGLRHVGESIEAQGYFDHRSVHPNRGYRDFSKSRGGVTLKVSTDEDWMMQGGISGERALYQYLPLSQDTLYDENDATRRIHSISGNLGGSKYLRKWKWSTNLNFRTIKDSEGPRDNSFAFTTGVNKAFTASNVNLSFDVHRHQVLGLNKEINFDRVSFQGGYQGILPHHKFLLGARLTYANQSFIPLPNFGYTYLTEKIKLESSLRGMLTAQSIGHLLFTNPFVNPHIDFSRFRKDYLFDLRASMDIGQITWQPSLQWNRFYDRVFYLLHLPSEYWFDPTYDNGSVFIISLEVKKALMESLNISARIEKSFFSLARLEKPYLTSTRMLSTQLHWQPGAWELRLGFDLKGGLYTYNADLTTSESMNPILDLRSYVAYHWNERWTLFGKANNMLNRPNQIWISYDQLPLHFLLGVRFVPAQT